MSQQVSNTNTNAAVAQSVWNKTPPPSPRLINEVEFPTPTAAARIAAEEKKARADALKERKAGTGAKDAWEKKDAAVSHTAEQALPTPLSAAPHRPAMPAEHTLESEPEAEVESGNSGQSPHASDRGDSLFSPVLRRAKGGKAKHVQGKADLPARKDEGAIQSQNRFEVLGQTTPALDDGTSGIAPQTSEAEAARQNSLRVPKPRKATKKGKLRPRGEITTEEGRLISRPNTPTPKSRRSGTPYDGRDSPLAEHRARGRQERRESGLHNDQVERADEDPEWRDVEDLDGLDISALTDARIAPASADEPAEAREHLLLTGSQGLPPPTPVPDWSNQFSSPNANVTPHHTSQAKAAHTTSRTQTDEMIGAENGEAVPETTNDPPKGIDDRDPSVDREASAAMTVDDEMPQIITQPVPTHEPTTAKIHELEFSFPTEDFELPRGNDPCFAYDNLDNEQMEGWPETEGHSFLVRQAGRGCPTAATEQSRKDEILSLLRRTIGLPKNARITAPAATAPFSGNRHPPHNFLVYNIDQAYFDSTTSFGGCISTKEGTLFFSPNFPVFDSLLGSINGFGDATADQIHALVNRALDKGNLNAVLKRIIEGQDLGGKLTTEEAITRIRRSLGVRIVSPRADGEDAIRAAHIFMDPPTHDITQWREFRDHAMQVNFKDPFLGMHIAAFPGWLCGICTSKLHTTAICPIVTERGWIYDQDLKSKPQIKKQPETKASRPPPLSFSTVRAGNAGNDLKPGRGGRGGRGRGNSSRGDRGRGGKGRP
ncbi:hypothetical protein BC835DRAFT_1303272 [Cytidiella melzeri]|nr:hypothetical protein BC835DRAFT_1303272 [Cytidiella melzeri]